MAKNKLEEFLSTLTEEQKIANIQALTYIKHLAAQTATDISKWDLLKTFRASEEDPLLIADKKTLNKLFFDTLQKVNEKTVKKIKELTKQQTDQEHALAVSKLENSEDAAKDFAQLELVSLNLAKSLNATKARREIDLAAAIRNNVRSLDQHYRQISDLHFSIANHQRELTSLNKDPKEASENIKKQLSSILEKGIWVNPIFKDNYLYLNSPANIVLQHINKSADVNITLDVGKLCVRIDTVNAFHMMVFPYNENIMDGRVGMNPTYHPHVHYQGQICWGNAAETYTKFIKDMQVDKILVLLHALLHTYSETNPYVSLADLNIHKTQLQKNRYPDAEYVWHPDALKDPYFTTLATNVATARANAAPPVFTQTQVNYTIRTTDNEPF